MSENPLPVCNTLWN